MKYRMSAIYRECHWLGIGLEPPASDRPIGSATEKTSAGFMKRQAQNPRLLWIMPAVTCEIHNQLIKSYHSTCPKLRLSTCSGLTRNSARFHTKQCPSRSAAIRTSSPVLLRPLAMAQIALPLIARESTLHQQLHHSTLHNLLGASVDIPYTNHAIFVTSGQHMQIPNHMRH